MIDQKTVLRKAEEVGVATDTAEFCGITFTTSSLQAFSNAIIKHVCGESEPVAIYQHKPVSLEYGVKWLIDAPIIDGTKLFTHPQPQVKEVRQVNRTGYHSVELVFSCRRAASAFEKQVKEELK
jgi:hypothetical protein